MTIEYRRGRIVLKDEPTAISDLERRMDEALQNPGPLTLALIATRLDTTVGRLRQHIARRVASGNWRFEPTAGRLIRKKHRNVR